MSSSKVVLPHDVARLRAFADLDALDADTVASLERVVRAAAHLFAVPIAAVALVDRERTRYVARHGLELREVDRAGSFADLVVLGDAVLEVGDASRDARFAGAALVAGPTGARFYAGAPLVLSDGHRVGALELIDPRRRAALGGAERAGLVDLAALAGATLASWARQRALEEAVREAERLGVHDPRTGALHRRGLTERLEVALSLARRGDGALPILAFRLAGLEKADEDHGPEAADAALAVAVQRLVAGVRDHDLVAHLGGGAFVVVLQAARSESAREVAARLLADLERPVDLDGVAWRLRPSVGVAAYPRDGEDALELLAAADRALRAAQDAGGGLAEAERG
ncbi:MAG: diguanylate cyclase [Trueperaceae bacterium]|nr:diguanylate cyclase [Trueperaceae bacterium]